MYSKIKRIMDIVGSLFSLIILMPHMIIIPILIKMTSRGPIFLRQTRLGKKSRPFTYLKFRTMIVDCEERVHKEYAKNLMEENLGQERGKLLFKLKNDPRITPIGRFLRKSTLDELPLFINVLKGDMSIVGPRPPLPYEVEAYGEWHKERLNCKPGITGLWQVHGRSSTTFDEMVRMDIRYIKEWSLWLDIKIILKTPWVVLTGKGAY